MMRLNPAMDGPLGNRITPREDRVEQQWLEGWANHSTHQSEVGISVHSFILCMQMHRNT